GLDELRLDHDLLAGQLAPARDRPDDRGTRRIAVEVLEPKLVREHARQSSFEDVELRERVLAERDQHVRPALPQELRQLVEETAGVSVVDEILLELVED